MNEVLIKRIEINKKVYRVPTLIHRLLKKDLKLLLFTKYNKNNELVFRDNIKVIEYEKTTLEKNKEYILKCENIILGKAKYIGNNTFKAISICIKNDIDKSIKDLFIDVNNDISDCKIEVYQKGLFRYYYDFLIQCLEDNNNYFFINKMTAISSYIVAKKFFKETIKSLEDKYKTFNKNISEYFLNLTNKFTEAFNLTDDNINAEKSTLIQKYSKEYLEQLSKIGNMQNQILESIKETTSILMSALEISKNLGKEKPIQHFLEN